MSSFVRFSYLAIVTYFFIFSLLLCPLRLKATDPINASEVAEQQEEGSTSLPSENSFYPLDSAPEVQSFSKTASLFFLGNEGIEKILPVWKNDLFQQEPNSSNAFSTHSLTWSDLADLLNYTAWRLGEASPLYTEEVKEHITCSKDPSSSWFWSSPITYTFQVKPESEDQIASLDFPTACRCVNVREVHYWLYCSLRKVEQALRAGQIIDQRWWNDEVIWKKKDPMVSYCRDHHLWPLLDSEHNHIQELLEKSTEIGFSQNKKDKDEISTLAKEADTINTPAVYHFPTTEELAFLPDTSNLSIWSTNNHENKETAEVRLTIDTSLMKKATDFENEFPSERLRKEISIATNQNQEALFNKDRVFKDELKITAGIVAGVAYGTGTGFLQSLFVFILSRLFGVESMPVGEVLIALIQKTPSLESLLD